MSARVVTGDCVEGMAAMDEASVDAIVCDPPYELGFMGKSWDSSGVAYQPATWAAALRVLKPGGHLLAFGGTRTYHRLACAVEDAGFEIRDCLTWIYASGFPKSLNVSKAIEGEALPLRRAWFRSPHGSLAADKLMDERHAALVERAEGQATHDGEGTALKPAHEPIIVARKPLDGTATGNVLKHGTGAINIDGCRIKTADNLNGGAYSEGGRQALPGDERTGAAAGMFEEGAGRLPGQFKQPRGRWPANVLLSHSEDCVLVGEQEVSRNVQLHESAAEVESGYSGGWRDKRSTGTVAEATELWACVPGCPVRALDEQSGTASRFFYCAKASRAERNAGLSEFVEQLSGKMEDDAYEWATDGRGNPRAAKTKAANVHPTVKPIELIRWLERLVTPPGGVILDMFAGSGTHGCAAVLEGFNFIGIEREPEYVAIAKARIAWWAAHPEGVETAKVYAAEKKRAAVSDAGQTDIFGAIE